jgi:hypothetical protein
MSRRSRFIWFGAAGLLVLAGLAGAVAVPGETGQLLALVLISLGFVLATSLVFLEIGLSEDRQRDRDRERGERQARRRPPARGPRVGLDRMRGGPRRLR